METLNLASVLYALPYMIIIAIAIMGSIKVMQNPRSREKRWMLVLLALSIIWAMLRGIQIFAVSPDFVLLLNDLEWVCVFFLPPTFTSLALELNNVKKWRKLISWILIFTIPILALLGFFANIDRQSILGQFIAEDFGFYVPFSILLIMDMLLFSGIVLIGFIYLLRLAWFRGKTLTKDGRWMFLAVALTFVIIGIDLHGFHHLLPKGGAAQLSVSVLVIYFVYAVNRVQETDLKHFADQQILAAMPTPLFPLVANRTTLYPQHQSKTRKKTKKKSYDEPDTRRSLIMALNKVTARTSSYVDSEGVLNAMNEELKLLDMEFILCIIDPDHETATVRYTSVAQKILRRIELMFDFPIIGLKLPSDIWSDLPHQALENETAVYSPDFTKDASSVFHTFATPMVRLILNLVNITDKTSGVHIAETLRDGRKALLTIWGEDIQAMDMPTFSVFAAQTANAFDRASLFDQGQQQMAELERSNRLVSALGNVTARASSVVGTKAVLDALDTELEKLGLQYLFLFTDEERNFARLRRITMTGWVLENLGKRIENSWFEIETPRERWPEIIRKAVDNEQPQFTDNILDFIPISVYNSRKQLIDTAMKQLNITSTTSAVLVPQRLEDGRVALFTVWGDHIFNSDIPAFRIFAGQITSAITKEQLHEDGQEKANDLARSNALIEALNLVAATVSSSTDINMINQALGNELEKMDLDCMVILQDEETQDGYIQYHSIDSNLIHHAERITKSKIKDQRIQLSQWPNPFDKVMLDGQIIFVDDFVSMVTRFISKHVPTGLAIRALKAINVIEETKGFFLPLSVGERTFGSLIIWGNSMKESDTPTFSIFTKQISIALDNAHLFRAQTHQSHQLQHSNELLEALGQLSIPIASSIDPQLITDVISDQFSDLDLNYVYLESDKESNKVTILHVSVSEQLMNYVTTATKLLPDGKTFSLKQDQNEGKRAITNNEVVFIKDLTQLVQNSINVVNKPILSKILNLANIHPSTSGINVPIRRSMKKSDLLVVWGDNLTKDDVNAFRIFKQQTENIIEINRLYLLAENEITERRIVQKEYQGLFENAHDAIVISEFSSHRILDANDRALQISGFTREEFLQRRLDEATPNPEKLHLIVNEIQTNHRPQNFEMMQYSKGSSEPRHMEINASVVTYKGKPALQSIQRDVTDRQKMEEKLRHDSLHDALTGLPNRTLFNDRLEHVIARSTRNDDFSFCVLYFDLDRFKDINDSLGHQAGDELLIQLAKELDQHVRETDTIARMGGDEFAILLEDIRTVPDIQDYCERILLIINQPFLVAQTEVVVSGSIGVAIGKAMVTKAADYLRDADIALYRAKGDGKNRYSIFDTSMRVSIMERLQIENNLRKAIQNNEFFLVYQPVIQLEDEKLIGFESLLRWAQPENGLVSPAEFIPIAEDIRLINQIGHWVLQTSCQQLVQWQADNPQVKDLKLNINVSALQLLRSDFPDEVCAVLAQYGIDNSQIALEITETAFITDQTAAAQQVDILKSKGFQIYLDDYGTGYSSLSMINLFDIDALKIDRQFILNLDDKKQEELVRTIIALGKSVGLKVIAEGIETEAHTAFLKQAGCGFGQGYYYAKPLSAEDAGKMIPIDEEK